MSERIQPRTFTKTNPDGVEIPLIPLTLNYASMPRLRQIKIRN